MARKQSAILSVPEGVAVITPAPAKERVKALKAEVKALQTTAKSTAKHIVEIQKEIAKLEGK